MKRRLMTLLALCTIISLAGCNNLSKPIPDTSKEEHHYSEDQPLFMAHDRLDTDDDSHIFHQYNYKGQLLNSDTSIDHIGCYAENGLAPAYDQATGKVGYVDNNGVFQIEPQYYNAAPFSVDGIALVQIEVTENDRTDYKYGYINTKGEEIIPCIYDSATSFFNNGYAIAAKQKEITYEDGWKNDVNWKEYILDKAGNVIVEIDILSERRSISYLYDGYFVCNILNEKEEYETDHTIGYAIYDYSDNLLTDDVSLYYGDATTGFRFPMFTQDGIIRYVNEKPEKFDGKTFVALESTYEIIKKRVATTKSGQGYGVECNGETVIPYEYDMLYVYGSYFVGIKAADYTTTLDIFDMDFNKTAEDLPYMFSVRYDPYGSHSALPDGYFEVYAAYDNNAVYGIIDYTGKVIVEPVFMEPIILSTYEGTGNFTID